MSRPASTSTQAEAKPVPVFEKTLARHVFKRCFKSLQENLTNESIVNTLWCENVLTQEEYEEINNLKTTKNRIKLINAMMTKTDEAVETFIKVLKSETASQGFIVEALEKEKNAFQNQQK